MSELIGERHGGPVSSATLCAVNTQSRDRGRLNRYANLHADTYAGRYIDGEGRLRLGFTRDADRHLDALRAQLAEPVEPFEVAPRWTLADLREARHRIRYDWDSWGREGIEITIVTRLEHANVVEISVREISDDIVTRLRDRYGEAVRIVQSATEPAGR